VGNNDGNIGGCYNNGCCSDPTASARASAASARALTASVRPSVAAHNKETANVNFWSTILCVDLHQLP